MVQIREEQRVKDMQRAMNAATDAEREEIKREIQDRAMHPEDVSKDSFKYKLLKFMTSIEPTMKRYTNELMFVLCNQDRTYCVPPS